MRSFSKLFVLFLTASLLILSCSKDTESPEPSPENPVTGALTLAGVSGSSANFDAATATYTITVPAGTDVKALKLNIPLATGATIAPDPAVARDYSAPVAYTITSNGKTHSITVKVVVSASNLSSAKLITSFRFAALSIDGQIDQNSRKITIKVPTAQDVTQLTPTLTLSEKATVSPASGTQQNFTNPVNYTVTAEDGSKQVYEVKVEKENVGGGKACLLTRVDFTNPGNDLPTHITFDYDQEGRVSRIINSWTNQPDATAEFTYNSNGEIRSYKNTALWTSLTFEVRPVYEGGKVTKMQYFNNGTLSEEVKISDFWDLKLDDQNRVLEFGSIFKFEYKNDQVSKVYGYDGETKELKGIYDIFYDDKNNFLSSSNPKGLTNFFYWISLQDISPLPYFRNNVTGTSEQKNVVTYKYNSKGFPIEASGTDYPSVKFTYSNCN